MASCTAPVAWPIAWPAASLARGRRECCSAPLDRICYSPTLVAVIAAVRAARFGAWGGGAEAADAPHAAHSTSPLLEPLERSQAARGLPTRLVTRVTSYIAKLHCR